MNRSRSLWLGLIVLVTALPASAQEVHPATDSLAVEADSTAPHHSLIASVLRKVTFRGDDEAVAKTDSAAATTTIPRVFDSRRDRIAFEAARAVAGRAAGFHLVVDIGDHRLYVIDGRDTVRSVSIATASNATLKFGDRSWHFETPRGVRTVLAKDKDPIWTPPEWHYAEVASEYGLKLRYLQRGQAVQVRDGTRLTTKGDEVGVVLPGETEFIPLVLDSHIVFDNTLFIPPTGTKHRSIQGELGHFRLKLGDGYQLHGTPYAQSIGSSVTHGCVRMGDEDIAWMYENVPVGTKVYLY